MKYDYEIAIIGGGPAGTSAALHLAKKGFDVCLLEKKEFPRDTICGEFLSKEVIDNLGELDIFSGFLRLNPNAIKSFRFISHSNRELSTSFDFKAYSLKRSTFDDFLIKQVEKEGVKIFQPAEAAGIENLNGSFNLTFYSLGKKISITIKRVIAAYGKQNVLDKLLRRNFIYSRSGFTGIKFHIDEKYFNNFNKDEIQIYGGDQIYCGINAVNDGMITLSFLEDRKKYHIPAKQHLFGLFNKHIKFNKLFKTNLQTVINNSTLYGTGNIYFGRKDLIENGVYMIGDAAGMIAPLTGDGIGMAFETGKLISDIILEEKTKNIDINSSNKKYIEGWNRLFKKRLFMAKLIQNSIFNNHLRDIEFNIVNVFPGMLNYLIKRTRT